MLRFLFLILLLLPASAPVSAAAAPVGHSARSAQPARHVGASLVDARDRDVGASLLDARDGRGVGAALVDARGGQGQALRLHDAASQRYSPPFPGQVAGFRLAGIEPDGDPIDQVLLNATLPATAGVPRLHLIVDAYLENFKPDTTPVLPDLLHPNQTAQNLGGFLDGKALITDDAGDTLYLGDFIAEAFLDNSNHAVVNLLGQGAARGGTLRLKGAFTLQKSGSFRGALSGTIHLPSRARAQLVRRAGAHLPPLKSLLNGVTVHPHAMMGRSTHSVQAPLHTGYGSNHTTRTISPVTVIAGAGAVLCFLLAAVLWWRQKGGTPKEQASAVGADNET